MENPLHPSIRAHYMLNLFLLFLKVDKRDILFLGSVSIRLSSEGGTATQFRKQD